MGIRQTQAGRRVLGIAGMTPALFERAGRAMFGDAWHAPMAAALGTRVDTVKKLGKGKSVISGNMARDVSEAMRLHADRLAAVRVEVERANNGT